MDGYWDNVCPWQSALENLSCRAEQARRAARHAINRETRRKTGFRQGAPQTKRSPDFPPRTARAARENPAPSQIVSALAAGSQT